MSHVALICYTQAATIPQSEYDFFFNADSDSFVRLAALSRRMHHLRPNLLNPRNTLSLWGDMMNNYKHWRKAEDPDMPDELVRLQPWRAR